jgi:hypothetical protein
MTRTMIPRLHRMAILAMNPMTSSIKPTAINDPPRVNLPVSFPNSPRSNPFWR